MFNEKFKEVLAHEGAFAIVTYSNSEAHVSNTWNSYVVMNGENQLLIPAAGMKKTQDNITANKKVKLTLGSKEVMGSFAMGAGFLLEGEASFLDHGELFDRMKEKFPFLSRVLVVDVTALTQTL